MSYMKFWGGGKKSKIARVKAEATSYAEEQNASSGLLMAVDPRAVDDDEEDTAAGPSEPTKDVAEPATSGSIKNDVSEIKDVAPEESKQREEQTTTESTEPTKPTTKESEQEKPGASETDNGNESVILEEDAAPIEAEVIASEPVAESAPSIAEEPENAAPSETKHDEGPAESGAEENEVDDETKDAMLADEAELHGESTQESKPDDEQDPEQSKEIEQEHEPVLNEDDEQFLARVTSQMQQPASLSRRATVIADDGEMTEHAETEEASTIPLPSPLQEEQKQLGAGVEKPPTWIDRWNQLSAFVPSASSLVPSAPSRIPFMSSNTMTDVKKQQLEKEKDRQIAGDSLQAAIDAAKSGANEPAEKVEEQNKRDMSSVLNNLNLSSINNRVVGISKDTQNLLEAFNTVLKDIINGAPTAYDDLEKLLTEREGQLDKLFGTLPPFLQTLVKSIPVKMYSAMAPSLAAAMSTKNEESSFSASSTDEAKDESEDKKAASKKKSLFPNLKSLVSEKGAVAAMLRSILNFLEMRFPALLSGTNVLMSLAVFVLLFVFWYCQKRGRETRLQKAADPEADGASSEKASPQGEPSTKEPSSAETADDADPPIEDPSLLDLEAKTSLRESAAAAAKEAEEAPDVALPGGTENEKPGVDEGEEKARVRELAG